MLRAAAYWVDKVTFIVISFLYTLNFKKKKNQIFSNNQGELLKPMTSASVSQEYKD